MAFDKESKKELLSLIPQTVLLKIIYINNFRFEISFLSKIDCGKKAFVSQGRVQTGITINYNSVLILKTLRHFKWHFWPCQSQ